MVWVRGLNASTKVMDLILLIILKIILIFFMAFFWFLFSGWMFAASSSGELIVSLSLALCCTGLGSREFARAVRYLAQFFLFLVSVYSSVKYYT